MRTFKLIICAMFVLCCGTFFTACATKEFDESNIIIGENQIIYDGKAHGLDVSYEGVDVEVSYALEDDKDNFKSLKQLNLVDVGTYDLYYRLSADGYKDFTSSGTLELTIKPRDVEVVVEDYKLIKSRNQEILLRHGYYTGLEEPLNLEFSFGEDFDRENVQCGETYQIECSTTNKNYNIIMTRQATLTVIDKIEINKEDGSVEYFATLQEAINDESTEENDVLSLNDSIYIQEGIEVKKSVVIDGRGIYSINAQQQTFEGTSYAGKALSSVFNVFDSGVELTLKDLTVDGGKIARGVSVFHGKLNIEGSTITNGKKTDKWRSGGVYITSDSSFVMTSGSIINNDSNDYEYTRFCADLWIGANAVGSLISITGGEVGNVFVNSNEYSANGAGKFTLDGGNIHSIYVEYDAGYGAVFEYISGNIDFLMISLPSEPGVWGVYEEVTPVENTTYIGGKLDYTND